MCGIAGKLSFEQGRGVDPGLIQRMCEVLAHRGPDDAAIWCDGPIGLGHRRLSVIDLTDAGRQPMCNTDGSLWIVLNGEIYNFLELRHELEQQGYRFRTRTDTEVLLHLYDRDGVDCLHRPGGRRGPGPLGIGAEHVAVKAVADLGDRGSGQQRRRPETLTDDVIHQVADRPALVGRRGRPLVVADLLDTGTELGHRRPEHRGYVHAASPETVPLTLRSAR